MEKFVNAMLEFAGKVSSNRYMVAIRDTFTDLLPIIIVTKNREDLTVFFACFCFVSNKDCTVIF